MGAPWTATWSSSCATPDLGRGGNRPAPNVARVGSADDAGMFGIDLPDWLEWLHWALRIKNSLIIALIVFVVVSALVKARD